MSETPNISNVLNEFQPANQATGDNPLIVKGTHEIQNASIYKIAGVVVTNKSTLAARLNNLSPIASLADFVKFLGLNDIIGGPVAGPSAGTWAMTRVAQGDYVNRKVAGDETPIIGIDITEILRTTAEKGLKLTSIDFIFRNTVANLDAHSATLDRIEYTDSEVVSVNTIAMTGTLAVGQDNDPQISTLTITTPLYNITDNSKYVLEHTINAAAASVVDWIGVMLKFARNDL